MSLLQRIFAVVIAVTTMISGWVNPGGNQPVVGPEPGRPPVVVTVPEGPKPVEQTPGDQPAAPETPAEPEAPVAEANQPDKPAAPRPDPPKHDKVAYLTFDDGPDAWVTPKILDILKEHDVKATFFVVGSKVDAYPLMLRRMKLEGHAIGNHTYSHIYSEIYGSPEAFLWSLVEANRSIERELGAPSYVMRPPGGSTGKFRREFMPLLAENGYEFYDWNVDSQDAINRKQTAAQMTERVLQGVRRHKQAVVLMHNINTPTTVEALPAIIKGIKSMGYEFAVIGPDTKPVQFTGN